MHKIERLLQTLAPKGVEFRKLGDIGEFYGGLVGKSKKSFSQGNKFYVPYINVFNNPQLDLNALESVQIGDKEKQNTIQLGDVLFTGSSENLEDCAMSCVVTQKIEKDIYLNSFCFGFRFFDKNLFNPSFLKHFLRDYNFRKNISKVANGVTRFNVSKQLLSKITIPIPPLEIQQEIVKILDAFTELNTELKARKKQYEYYQNMLLDFKDINSNHKDAKEKLAQKTYPKRLKTLLQTLAPEGVEFRKLGEVCEIIRGKRVTKKEILDKGKYPVVSGGIGFMGYLNEYNREENTITIAQYGTAGFVNWQNQKFWANDVCFSVIPKETLINRYLYYVLTNMQNYLYSISNRSAIPYSISSNNIMQITIPIPPLEIQQEIVKILDQFLALTTDLLAGIPAEIKARKKQYEYYREKLLSFKPLTPHKEVKKC
ncbi:restriction endonuclease subunit S [Helicobacter pylori]|uniref:restriction endonuclease subunit S n=1 Tax=Helicobacter pylori TaxID=210 RepID=UPI0012B3E74B|nr:restriction endonuclease subunit S [Helicobacter pylori]